MIRALVIAGGLAVALGGCAAVDPIEEDDSQQSAGIETTTIESDCGRAYRRTGREASSETFDYSCKVKENGDLIVTASWSNSETTAVDSHKARAGVAIASSDNIAEVAPDGIDALKEILGPLFVPGA